MTTDAEITGENPEVQEAIQKVRPLNATQAKALRTLVQQDFDVVERDMHTLYQEEVRIATQRVKDEFKDKGKDADKFRRDALALAKSFQDARALLIEEARINGVALEMPDVVSRYGSSLYDSINVHAEGEDRAVQEAVAEVRRNYERATVELRRNQTNVERRILVAQVTGDAEDLLKALPSAQTLMLSSAAEQAQANARGAITS